MKVSLSDQILGATGHEFHKRKKPEWLRAKLPGGPGYQRLRAIIDDNQLHTVCESAKCPNMGECWSRGTATIMILGDVCTRSCGFCHIKTGRPPTLDLDEPRRVAHTAALLNLKHIVITSVNRDELRDGGAAIWAETIMRVREASPQTSIEVLIPDFCGDWDALDQVLEEMPDILNHNMESVRRLYSVVRPQAKYDRSIELLRRAKAAGLNTKTGIMLGIGEEQHEIEELMHDVVSGSGCDILTIGQYLQPTRDHLPISRWVTPDEFKRWKARGEEIGFKHVESGPLVRSSYHADEQVQSLGSAGPA
jgi:lipoic acid synthetase